MRMPRIGSTRRALACCTAALILVSRPLYAECVFVVPEAHATARVLSCQRLDIGPSNAKIPSYEAASAERMAQRYFHDQTANFSGTLLLVQLLSDSRDPQGNVTNWPKDWKQGAELPLVSSQPASELCKIESTIEVTPDQVCCDTFPADGKCIIPTWLKIRRALISPAGDSPR